MKGNKVDRVINFAPLRSKTHRAKEFFRKKSD